MKKQKRIIFFTCVILLVLTSGLNAQVLNSPLQIDIYPQGMDATWRLAAETEMELILPSSFDRSRIRYQVGEGAEVIKLEAEYEASNDWTTPAVAEIVAEINKLEQDIKKWEIELAGIEQTIKYLANGTSLTNLADPLGYYRDAQSLRIELEAEKQELLSAKKNAEQRIQQLNQQLVNRFGGNHDRLLKIKITTNGVGYLDLVVYSRHASWEPFYRVALDSNTNLVTLNSYISVHQRTGLDFNGVVRTHTGTPIDNISVPSLNPLVARIFEPQPNQYVQRLGNSMSPMVSSDAFVKVVPEMGLVDGPVGITYEGSGAIPSSNSWSSLSLASHQIPVTVETTLIPYESKEAWVLAEAQQPVPALLSGKAELIVDGSLTGQSQLSHAGGDDLLAFGFGRSPLITAERQPLVYTEGQTWLRRNIRSDGYTIEITNGSSQTTTTTVIDRIPISGNERLNITTEISPLPSKNEEGILTWKITLAPGEKQTISVKYQIQYPDGVDLVIQ